MRQETIQYLKKIKLPVYIWGSGEIARLTRDALIRSGIHVDGYVVDALYEKAGEDVTKNVLIASGKKYVLIKGFLEAFYMADDEIINQWPGCQNILTIPDIYEPSVVEPMSEEFYLSHKNLFDHVRLALADDLSVKSLDAYIEAKISMTNHGLLPIVERKQYFFDGAPWVYERSDILYEGGAYNGDSILDFIALRQDQYQKIIAFEPDKNNYLQLLRTIEEKSLKRIEALNCGLYNKITVLRFSSCGTMESAVSEQGSAELEVNTIDNVAQSEIVSIIKLDIEGSEMDALYGAEVTIKRCRPILMISVYHRKEDIYRIFEFINTRVENYVYYFRCHKPMAIDAVLYAVPLERHKIMRKEEIKK